ncbi:MAG: capsule biosynthesis protein [Pseudomonadota bacterium]
MANSVPTPEAAATKAALSRNGNSAEQPTGRQLRTARRIAQKHGIKVSSDKEAVAALRARGIDPFERANMLQVVPAKTDGDELPATTDEASVPASPATIDASAGEIVNIQRDIARRRRRRLALLGTRLAFFVGLPTLIAGFYYYNIATPMYATNSEFVIQQADAGSSGAGGLGGLFSGAGLATQTDSISVQSYLLSRDALQRLDADHGFTDHFSGEEVDRLQRLAPDATMEAAYDLYRRVVQIGYDPTEGVVKMEVIAANPQVSAQFSEALIGYATDRINELTIRLRNDQMAGAEARFEQSEQQMLSAQSRIVDLQEQLGVVSAEAEVSNTMTQIGTIETELRLERMQLEELLANPRPQQTRVEVAERSIAQLEVELDVLRASLTQSATDEASLARVTAELQVAQQDLETRQVLLQQAAQDLETARIEANRQVRYLSTPVPPIAPDEPAYPKAFENTVLAFLIFSGIYLMVSLTAAILREQVSG